MGEDRLEKFIKKQVEQHKTPNDPDLLWQKIQAKQNAEEKPKRRFILFWWLGGAFLLIAVGLLLTYALWNTQQQGGADSTPKATTTSVPKTNPVQSEEESRTADQTAATAVTQNDSPTSTTSADERSLNTPSNQRTTTESATGTPRVAADPITNTTKRPTTTADDNSTSADEVGRSTSDIDQATDATDIAPSAPAASTEIPVLENNPFLPTTPRDTPAKEDLPQASLEYPVDPPSDDSQIVPASKSLPTLELNVVSEVREIEDALVKSEEGRSTDQNGKAANHWRFSNGLAFAYGQGLRTLSERTPASADYLQTRERSETPLDAVRINLDVMAQHKSGVYLKSGLEYERINERFEAYLEWDSTEVEPNQILAITFAMDGTSTETTGNGEVSTTYWTRQRIYNHYHSIDIPLMVGYSRTKKDQRLGWFVEGGASVNLWFGASGKILSTTNELLSLADEPSLFKSQTGLSLVGALGLTYQVADQFSIWANPAIKYRLRSITSEENSLNQEYMNLGVNVGMRYWW